jgi:FdhE protein
MIPSAWDRRIERAEELVHSCPSAAEMLRFYREIARLQKTIYEAQVGTAASAPLLSRLCSLEHLPALLSLVKRIGPPKLVRMAGECVGVEEGGFFERCLLQPCYEYRAGLRDIDRNVVQPDCPFCGERPLVGVLRGEGDGAKRSLICSLCATEWDFRRLLCPGCGEERPDRLPVYTAEEVPYVRIEACDACHMYIKAVDLSRNGLAVPVVDELATVSLNLWAEEHGYSKVRLNLLGM